MGSGGKRRSLRRDEGAPKVHGEVISLDADEGSFRLGTGRRGRGVGWVSW